MPKTLPTSSLEVVPPDTNIPTALPHVNSSCSSQPVSPVVEAVSIGFQIKTEWTLSMSLHGKALYSFSAWHGVYAFAREPSLSETAGVCYRRTGKYYLRASVSPLPPALSPLKLTFPAFSRTGGVRRMASRSLLCHEQISRLPTFSPTPSYLRNPLALP